MCILEVADCCTLCTLHRIIVGKDYYDPYSIAPETAVEAALSLLLGKKLPRQTEGMLLSSQFPINYFSISEVEQWFGVEFQTCFEAAAGADLKAGDDDFWRFNRVFDYGPMKQETSEQLRLAVGRYT